MVDLSLDIPEGYIENEEKDGYYVTSHQKEVWAVELDLLSTLLDVCEKNDIKVYMGFGSLIGAIRHNGFIPWDDDIDVVLFREDYKKLCRIAKKEFKDPYFFQTEYTDPGTLRGHAQLRRSDTTGILKGELKKKYKFNQGIFIDIFPIDLCPDNEKERKRFGKKASQIMSLAEIYAAVSSRYHKEPIDGIKAFFKKILYICFGKWCSFNLFYWLCEKYIQKYNNKKTNSVGVIIFGGLNPQFVWEKKWFEEICFVKFEFLEVPVPQRYRDILFKTYGKWEEPVQKPTIHGDVVFDTNISYEDYIKKNKSY